MSNLITKTTELAMKIISEYVKSGDSVIDATAGNGHDTLALAELVGPDGKVYAFDLQEEALKATERLLLKAGMGSCCELVLKSHHLMKEVIPEEENGKIAVIVFNLGYLPAGDKNKTTMTTETLPAVAQGLEMIKPNGLVAITMYSGHEEGAKEKETLLKYAKSLPEKQYHSVYVNLMNQKKNPPELLLITKKK